MYHKIKDKQNLLNGNRSRSSNITQTSSCPQNRNKKENEIRAQRTDAKSSSKKYKNSYTNSKLDHKTVLNNKIVKNKSRTALKRHSNDTYGEPNRKYKKNESSVIESPKKNTAELRIQNIRRSFEKAVQNEALNTVVHHDTSHKRYSANARLEKLRKSLTEKVNNETITKNVTSNYNNRSFTEDCDVEMMDWETIPEQQIIDNIIKVRSTVFDSNTEILTSLKCNSSVPSTINSLLCIVIDTNIFISHLEFIQHLMGAQFGDKGRPLLVVPWIVLQELDIIKDRRCNTNIQQLQQSARQAVNFLNERFIKNDSHIIGQTPIDASNELFNCKSPDDRILNCCLQFSRDNNFVVLLSNDKNLRNKALVSNIPAYNRDEIISRLQIETSSVVHENPPIQRTVSSFGSMKDVTCKYWTVILETEMKKAYGDIWLRIVYKKPPWNIINVLACFIKHWIAVFSLIWPSSVRYKIEELNKFLQMSGIELRGPDTETLQNLLIDICSIIGQSCPEYESDMTRCIQEIKVTINL